MGCKQKALIKRLNLKHSWFFENLFSTHQLRYGSASVLLRTPVMEEEEAVEDETSNEEQG